MRLAVLCILLLSGGLSWAVMHEYHVCITRIDHRAQTGTLEVTVKVFTDDLERSLERMGAPRLRIGDGTEHPQTDSIVSAYLGNRLKLELDGQALPPRFLGKEVELDATWCYLEFRVPPSPKELKISNKILTELFGDQSNMVHFHAGSKQQSLLMDADQTQGTVYF